MRYDHEGDLKPRDHEGDLKPSQVSVESPRVERRHRHGAGGSRRKFMLRSRSSSWLPGRPGRRAECAIFGVLLIAGLSWPSGRSHLDVAVDTCAATSAVFMVAQPPAGVGIAGSRSGRRDGGSRER